MQSDSLHFIPSFDSIPHLLKDPINLSNEMRLIVSKIDIQSVKSISEEVKKNIQNQQVLQYSIASFQQEQQEGEKQIGMGTYQSLKMTPKKRKRVGCVCKKTGCLKLYCQCFASGKNCSEECSCCNCSNVSENNQELDAVRRARKNRSKNTDQKRSCNCKKSQCLKKYCQCYNSGLACTQQCKCDYCCNNQPHK